MKKNVKRTVVWMLTLVLLCGFAMASLSGCQKQPGADTGESTTDTLSAEEVTVNEEEVLLADLNPADYGGKEFKFLNNSGEPYLSQLTSDDRSTTINSAIYSRNAVVEEQLNIIIEENRVDSNTITSTMRNLHYTGTYEYDACYNVTRYQNVLVKEGVYHSIHDYEEYLDLEKPWWYQSEIDALTISGNCFLLTGDMQLTRNDCVWCVAFNRDTISDFGASSPYDLIDSNEWTFESMYQIGVDTWTESSTEPYNYALVSHPAFAGAIAVAGGLTLIQKDEEKGLVRATIDTHYLDVLGAAIDYFFTDNGIGERNGVKTDYTSMSFLSGKFGPDSGYFWHGNEFERGDATFMVSAICDLRTIFTNKDNTSMVQYGVAPMPKYNSEQEQYYNYVYSVFQCVGIPSSVESEEDLAYIANVMEWMNAYSYVILRPAYYDIVLYARLLQEERAVEALDIVFGFDERGKATLELDYIFELGMTSKLQVCLSDCNKAYNNAVRTIASYVDSGIADYVKAYSQSSQ